VPEVRAIGARNYSPYSTLHADATILGVCVQLRIKRLLAKNRLSTSLRFPFAYLANKRRKVVIRPGYVNGLHFGLSH
jgi:hypothetical protein